MRHRTVFKRQVLEELANRFVDETSVYGQPLAVRGMWSETPLSGVHFGGTSGTFTWRDTIRTPRLSFTDDFELILLVAARDAGMVEMHAAAHAADYPSEAPVADDEAARICELVIDTLATPDVAQRISAALVPAYATKCNFRPSEVNGPDPIPEGDGEGVGSYIEMKLAVQIVTNGAAQP